MSQVIQQQVARVARYRHVVFRDLGRRGGQGRALDLAPPLPSPATITPSLPFGALPATELSRDEERFVEWLFARGGLSAASYRPETLRRRLPACLRAIRADSVSHAMSRLETDPAAVGTAINTLVIGVTSFFRDAAVFAYLRDEVLPTIRRAPGRPRAWSAGCSDGEEIYSLAILLAELDLLDDAYLLGTDCRPGAVARGRAGCYDRRLLRDVPPPLRHKYFEPHDDAMRVRGDLRAAVQWRTADVTRLQEPGAWDLICCRNLAMYLRPDVAGRLWAEFERALRPGGFLVLGKAERPIGPGSLLPAAPCVYRKAGVR